MGNMPDHTGVCKRCNEVVDLERTHGRYFCDGCLDTMVRDFEAMRLENDTLRMIAARIMPCHYCGVDQLAKCPHGFPGCALADDLIVGESSCSQVIRHQKASLIAVEKWVMGEPLCVSTGIDDSQTYGYGELDEHGFWEYPLPESMLTKQTEIRDYQKVIAKYDEVVRKFVEDAENSRVVDMTKLYDELKACLKTTRQ